MAKSGGRGFVFLEMPPPLEKTRGSSETEGRPRGHSVW